jgi:LPXTG-motif cell wall-anchored protein
VTKYASGWTTGASPIDTLTLPTNFGAHAVAFDSQDNMYVAETQTDSVKKYAAGWVGGALPIATLTAGLQDPVDIAFDSSGQMYVANLANNTVKRYAAGWTTGASSLASITTGGPISMAFDSDGNLHVISFLNDTIEKFTAGWADGALSVATLSIPNSTLTGVTFDSGNQMYVSDYTSDAVKRFAATPAPSTSFVVPIRKVTIDPNGGTCLDTVPHTEVWDSWFALYRYIPGAADCTRTGHTFAGWARSTTPTVAAELPLLTDPSDGIFRYFIAEDADLIAIWTKNPDPQPPSTAPGGPVTLPVTGGDSPNLLALGVLLIVVGAVIMARRRQSTN